MGSTICTAGFPSPAIASGCFTALCASIWYGFFIATLLFSAKENCSQPIKRPRAGSRYFLREHGCSGAIWPASACRFHSTVCVSHPCSLGVLKGGELILVMAQHLQISVEGSKVFVGLHTCLSHANVIWLLPLLTFCLTVLACDCDLPIISSFEGCLVRFTLFHGLIQWEVDDGLQLRWGDVLGCTLPVTKHWQGKYKENQRYDLHASTLHRPACETQLYEFQTSIPPTLAWSKRSCAWHHAGSVGWNGGHRGIPRMLLLYAAPGVESVRIRLSGLSTRNRHLLKHARIDPALSRSGG